MKVIHAPPRYFPAISGSEFYFQRISELLKGNQDIEVHCTNALDFRAFHDEHGKIVHAGTVPERVNGVPVFRHAIDHDETVINREIDLFNQIVLQDADFRDFSISKNGPYSMSLRACLEDRDFDLVHATCFPYFNIFHALQVAKMKGIPCILTPFIHGENPRYQDESVALLDHFTRVLACSPSEAAFLAKRGVGKDKIKLITMGVDVGRFARAIPGHFLEYAGIEGENTRIVLFCGYKNYEKGAISLLRAIPLVAKRVPKCLFVMIGPSTKQYNIELKKLGKLKNRVINMNPASLSGYFDKKKLGAFKACDVYAMPSRSDAYGIAYLEAWASKKPVVSSSIPAMKDLIQHGREGCQVKFDDVTELAKTLVNLLENPRLREKMGQNGFQKIQDEKLTWKHVSKMVSRLYQDIL